MYDMIKEKLVDCGIATPIVPTFMSKEGEKLSEENQINERAYGCKATIEITNPEMVVLADKVGCNTSLKGDGHVGGETYVCKKGQIPQKKSK